VADAAFNPEEQAVAAEWQLHLQGQIEALPERDRQCLLLRAEGLPYRDIARVLGVSLGFVAKSLARSFGRLDMSRGGR
jgi:RNA polymerase sigma-70 factor (ECF subfamily)